MKYLLDTDTLSFILRGEGKVEEHFRAERPSQVCTSPIAVGEIELALALVYVLTDSTWRWRDDSS